MYRHYLYGHEIEEPNGFDGSLFKKELSDVYHGYMSNAYGVSLSDLNLQITIDELPIKKIISDTIKKDGFSAKISYNIKFKDSIVFDGYIDVNSYSEDCCSCSFTLIESSNDSFLSKRTTKYGVNANTDILFTGKRVFTSTTFVLNDAIKQYSYINTIPKIIRHNIPLKIDKNTLTKLSANTIDIINVYQSFLANSSNSIINTQINGVIELTALSTPQIQFSIKFDILDVNNNLVSSDIVGSYLAAGVSSHVSININKYLLPGNKCYLYVDSSVLSNNFDFIYSASSLTITDSASTELKPSTIKAVLLKDCFSELLNRMNSVGLCSNWLSNCGANFAITNGYNLRGINKPVNLDFEYLFENISKIFCIGANYDKSCIKIEELDSLHSCDGFYDFGMIEGNLKANPKYNYSSIVAGFNKWQSKTLYSTDEYNASHTYTNESNNSTSNELNVKSDIIASSYLIEELRLMGFESEKLNVSTEFDESIFIVSIVKDENGAYKAETDEEFVNISGIISPNDTYNLRLTPKRIALRWVNYLGLNNIFLQTAYEGNNQLSCNKISDCDILGQIDEFGVIAQVDNRNRFSIFETEIVLNEDPSIFNVFPSCIKYTICDNEYYAMVNSLDFKPNDNYGEITINAMNYN